MSSQASATRRRWYQFGIGTMFLAVAIFAVVVWLAGIVWRLLQLYRPGA